MLPPFIIEQIRNRETQERRGRPQPRLELPIAPAPSAFPADPTREDECERGVVIIDLLHP
ncbi:MAG: hypothetical protein ACPGUV_03160 [Polyangiales bacterium]